VFNLQGLAALNRRTAEVFNNNPLVPSKSSSQAWGKKIRAKRSAKLPEDVAALAQKIVDDNGVLGDDEAERILDPISTLDSMAAHLIEDELLDDVFGVGSISDKNL
jgi:hypothetical protein